jgi:16S rRNA processing protein RimM
LPSCEALEVLPEPGAEPLLVPMVKDAIRSVEIERERIEVDLEFLGLEESGARPAGGGRGQA